MQVDELLTEIGAAEERLQIEPLSIDLLADGSGDVMFPELNRNGELCGAESAFHFVSVHELVHWLRHSPAPKEAA